MQKLEKKNLALVARHTRAPRAPVPPSCVLGHTSAEADPRLDQLRGLPRLKSRAVERPRAQKVLFARALPTRRSLATRLRENAGPTQLVGTIMRLAQPLLGLAIALLIGNRAHVVELRVPPACLRRPMPLLPHQLFAARPEAVSGPLGYVGLRESYDEKKF